MKNIDVTKKYALAVSGGVDSMVMLHAFATRLPRPNFFVVTVNHGIRQEAQRDCDFVADYCAKLGVECVVHKIDVPTFAKQNKLSEETAARILRYQILEKLPCDYVCLAHHANDNAETVLMHILRGAGARGAEGIKRQKGKYLRPLLSWTKQQILQYAEQNSVPFVEDSTNAQAKYTRNALRQKVMPLLEQLYPNVQQNIVRFAQNVSADNEYLDSLADISTVEFDDKNQSAQIPIQLLAAPTPIAYRVLHKVFAQLGIHHDVESCHLQQIVQLSRNNGGKKLSLPFDLVAINDYNKISIFNQSSPKVDFYGENAQHLQQNACTCQDFSCQTSVDDSASDNDANAFSIPFAVGENKTPLGIVHVTNQKPNCPCLTFDLNKVGKNAVFRTMQQGDVFCKFGGCTKKLNRYLIDKKIPHRQRAQLLLLAEGNQVLVVCGVEISHKIKVDKTSNVYYVYLTKEI